MSLLKRHSGWKVFILGFAIAAVSFMSIPSRFMQVAHAQDRGGGPGGAWRERLDAAESRIAELESLLMHFRRTGDDIYIEGANLHVRNGTGTTDGAPNALGNVVIGYNELRPTTNDRSGSHMLVVGKQHNYTTFGGIVVGIWNSTTGDWSVVNGGTGNRASGLYATVSGGIGNESSEEGASVSGGLENEACGLVASVSGGVANTACGPGASVSGGNRNEAEGTQASVSGGSGNDALGANSSVSGGRARTASGDDDWVGGGLVEDD
jgi:hypothetical protein